MFNSPHKGGYLITSFIMSLSSCLLQCQTELKKGFGTRDWKRLVAPPQYIVSLVNTLQQQYPQYDIKLNGNFFIWIDGDANAAIAAAKYQCNEGLAVIHTLEKHRTKVLEALRMSYPNDTFNIGKWPKLGEWGYDEVIIRNNHRRLYQYYFMSKMPCVFSKLFMLL